MTAESELLAVLEELHNEGASLDDVLSLAPPALAAYVLAEAAAGVALDRIGWDLSDDAEEWQLSARIMAARDPATLEDVGSCFGLTRERTRQIQRDASRKLVKTIPAEVADALRGMLLDMEQARPDITNGPIEDNGLTGLRAAPRRHIVKKTKAEIAAIKADARARMHDAQRRYRERGEAIRALNEQEARR